MPGTGQALTKGERTREEILRIAQDLCCEIGLEGMTIAALASRAGLSKSGLYAHFKSKEDLQCAILDAARAQFIKVVMTPAVTAPRGLPRIERLIDLWMKWEDMKQSGGCSMNAAATDFDDRPGFIHDKVAGLFDEMIRTFSRAAEIAVAEGHFDGGLDTRQFGVECWGILLARQQLRRLLKATDADSLAKRSFADLISRSLPRART